eukprot:SAG22_NODE_248_length_13909_cov_141.345112_8_plen_677_part_00
MPEEDIEACYDGKDLIPAVLEQMQGLKISELKKCCIALKISNDDIEDAMEVEGGKDARAQALVRLVVDQFERGSGSTELGELYGTLGGQSLDVEAVYERGSTRQKLVQLVREKRADDQLEKVKAELKQMRFEKLKERAINEGMDEKLVDEQKGKPALVSLLASHMTGADEPELPPQGLFKQEQLFEGMEFEVPEVDLQSFMSEEWATVEEPAADDSEQFFTAQESPQPTSTSAAGTETWEFICPPDLEGVHFGNMVRQYYHLFEVVCSPAPFEKDSRANLRVRAVWQMPGVSFSLGHTDSVLLEFEGSAIQRSTSFAIFRELYRVHQKNNALYVRCTQTINQLRDTCSEKIFGLLAKLSVETAVREKVKAEIDKVVSTEFAAVMGNLTQLVGSRVDAGSPGELLQQQHDLVCRVGQDVLIASQDTARFASECGTGTRGLQDRSTEQVSELERKFQTFCKERSFAEFDAIKKRAAKTKTKLVMSAANHGTGFGDWLRQRAHQLQREEGLRVVPILGDVAEPNAVLLCEGSQEQYLSDVKDGGVTAMVKTLDKLQLMYVKQTTGFGKRLRKFTYELCKTFRLRMRDTVTARELIRYSKKLTSAFDEKLKSELKDVVGTGEKDLEKFHEEQRELAISDPAYSADDGAYMANVIVALTQQSRHSNRIGSFATRGLVVKSF